MRSTTLPLFILTLAAVTSAADAGITSSWIGRSGGSWSISNNWTAGVPGTGPVTDAVITTGRNPLAVTQDGYYSIASLTIGAGCTLNQINDRDLSITGLVNNGLWTLSSAGSGTDIQLNADLFFDGTGAVEMGNSPANRIYSIGVNRTLVNTATHTIRGSGTVGLNNTAIVNDGLIEAVGSSGLFIDIADSMSLDNNGLMRATNGSSLTLYGSPVDNTDGEIRAEDGSQVWLRWGSMTGGLLKSLGTGAFLFTSESCAISDVTLDGTAYMPNDADVILAGTINNQGTWQLASAGSATDIALNSPIVTLAGPGKFLLGDSPANRIYSIGVNRTLENTATHTIRGSGTVGNNNTAIVNDGLIEAVGSSGLFIDIADTMSLDNNGLMRATAGSSLTLYGSPVDNTDGEIRAEDGSQVWLRWGSMTGGLLKSLGTGAFLFTSEACTISDVTLDGTAYMPNDADVILTGTINNQGTWQLASAGSGTDIALNSPIVTLAGPGKFLLGDSPANRIYSIGVNRTLVNTATHTIRGSGTVGLNNTAIVNDGLIEAVGSSGLFIDIADSMSLDNNGLMRATNGSSLTLYGSPVDNTDGEIRAEDGSQVWLRWGFMTGGLLKSLGTGAFLFTSEACTIGDVTLAGTAYMPNDADVVLTGTINNHGTWQLASAGSGTDIELNNPTVTFTGPGQLLLGDSPANRIYSVGTIRTLVNGIGHSIVGGGTVGFNNTLIENKGLIEANQSTGMSIDPWDSGPSWNEGTMRVSGAGSMNIAFGAWENRGLMDVDATRLLSRSGTYVQTDGETRVDGTMSIDSGSYTQSGGLLSGDGVVNSAVSIQGGSASPSNADGSPIGSLSIGGNYSQGSNGGYVVDLGLSGNDVLAVSGNAALGGALQVRLVAPFLPLPGQEFTILTAANINGVFGCVKFPNAGAGYFHLVYSPTSVKLVVDNFATTGADLNFDGVVGADDLAVLLGSWGNEPCNNSICCPADLDGDGKVNGVDLAILLGEWD